MRTCLLPTLESFGSEMVGGVSRFRWALRAEDEVHVRKTVIVWSWSHFPMLNGRIHYSQEIGGLPY